MLLTQSDKCTVSNRTIKNNHLFLVDTMNGEIPMNNNSGLGLYNRDTRYLSGLEIQLNNTLPLSLFSSSELGYLSTLVYTNGQMSAYDLEGVSCMIPEESIEFKRESILDGALFERYTLTSYNIEGVKVNFSIRFAADFRDIFEIRHLVPFKIRILEPPSHKNNMLRFVYKGDKRVRETRILFKDFTPHFQDAQTISVEMVLRPLERKEFNLEIQTLDCPISEKIVSVSSFDEAMMRVRDFSRVWSEQMTEFESDNQDFNEMVSRSAKDLRMLLTQSEDGGYYVAAGIPWYVCLFGRDSIITARESLIFNPTLAKWTLSILAKHQGKEVNPWRDEEPGKILHELRTGELAEHAEIPHTPYYGSVDATPLWIILLYDYYLWTRDIQLLEELWPNALAAMAWIDQQLDQNNLGYLSYLTRSSMGIAHQGWKDSGNSAMYENGIQAEPPIALVEVQGYVYLAKKRLAILADIMEDKALKTKLRKENRAFRQRFGRDFWQDDLDFCAMGLDSQGRPLRVIASNAGHCLETGILTAAQAGKVASRLMAPDMFNGWGIRTLSANMMAYNPMSYHNGTIWPHDNAIIARGMAVIGRQDYCDKIFTGLYESARLLFYKRLPELYCGFSRDLGKADPPVKYPVACSPQAWAAASIFSLIGSMLNLNPDFQEDMLKIKQPRLPHWINELQVKNLRVGSTTLNLGFKRSDDIVMVDVQKRHGKMDILLKI
jgi:glycogen debranching enzyme